ncbi:MAG TPA: hypothetical protein VLQ89_06555, partial [Candidatus Binatia bacterium]|nr:hypothetical protein [Candidatus Binatia bacterium]
LQKRSLRRQDFLHSSLLWFERMAVVSGFIGYPHLLTLLAMIDGLENKEIYFLGSAGAIDPRWQEPAVLQVSAIRSSSVFKRFSRKNSLALDAFPGRTFPAATGVSVDVIQRETPSWLAAQRREKTDFVEMELYPLRWFLDRPFRALVVLSDRVEPSGIRPFKDKKKFQREFARAFTAIDRQIHHG